MKNEVNRNAETFLLWCTVNDPHGDHLIDVTGSFSIGCSKLKKS